MPPPTHCHEDMPEVLAESDDLPPALRAYIKTQQPASAPHLPPGELILGKGFVQREQYAFHAGMCFEVIHHLPRRPGDPLETYSERSKPPDQQPGIKRLDPTADIQVFTIENLLHSFPASGKYAADGVAVAADIFCGRLHADIDAQFDRPLIQRGTIAVIDDRHDPFRAGQLGYRTQVLQLKVPGIRRLEIDQAGGR